MKKNNNRTSIVFRSIKPSIAFVVSALIAGCGGATAVTTSSGISSILTGLSQLPSASTMVASNSAASKEMIRPSSRLMGHDRTVSGTPPAIINLTTSNVDQYFYSGLIAKIKGTGWTNEGSTAEQADANAFFGQTTGGASGQAGCNMVAGLAQSFNQLLQNTNSTCYMKNIPLASGVTVTGSSAADVFTQTAADKIVEAKITNMSQGGGGTVDMNVFIVVSGTNSVGSDTYKTHLYMCQVGQSTPNQDEVITITKSTGLFTDVSNQNQGGTGYAVATTYLVNSNGSLAFDSTKARTVDSYYSDGNGNVFKSKVEIDSNNSITTQSYNTYLWNNVLDKGWSYSISDFSGTSLKDLAFTQGGYSGKNSCANCNNGSPMTNTFTSGIEYQSTFYAAAPSSSLATSAASGFTTALTGYLADTTAPTFDYTKDDCSATPTVVVSADFSTTSLQAVQTTCQGDSDSMNNIWQICQGADLQTAYSKIMSSYQGTH